MSIVATQVIDVQSDIGMINKALEKFKEQVHIKIANSATLERDIVFKARTPGKVDDYP